MSRAEATWPQTVQGKFEGVGVVFVAGSFCCFVDPHPFLGRDFDRHKAHEANLDEITNVTKITIKII